MNFIKWYLNPYYWVFPRYIVFVEEVIRNEKYKNYIGGRIEVRSQWKSYSINEWRILTNNIEEFNKFQDKYILKDITLCKVKKLKKIANKYNKQE